jgi:hypothetical protein
MDSLPFVKQHREVRQQGAPDFAYLMFGETPVLVELYRPFQPMKDENSLFSLTDHVDVRSSMIIRIHNHSKGANPKYGWHGTSLSVIRISYDNRLSSSIAGKGAGTPLR